MYCIAFSVFSFFSSKSDSYPTCSKCNLNVLIGDIRYAPSFHVTIYGTWFLLPIFYVAYVRCTPTRVFSRVSLSWWQDFTFKKFIFKVIYGRMYSVVPLKLICQHTPIYK